MVADLRIPQPSHIPASVVQEGQQWPDRIRGHLLHLDDLQHHLRVCPSPLLLEPDGRSDSKGQVLESGSHLVRKFFPCARNAGVSNNSDVGSVTPASTS
jgi:hypothetical protein